MAFIGLFIIIITPLIFLFIIHKIFKDKTDKNYETIKKFGYLFFEKKFYYFPIIRMFMKILGILISVFFFTSNSLFLASIVLMLIILK